jgi:hypothetical protein
MNPHDRHTTHQGRNDTGDDTSANHLVVVSPSLMAFLYARSVVVVVVIVVGVGVGVTMNLSGFFGGKSETRAFGNVERADVG